MTELNNNEKKLISWRTVATEDHHLLRLDMFFNLNSLPSLSNCKNQDLFQQQKHKVNC